MFKTIKNYLRRLLQTYHNHITAELIKEHLAPIMSLEYDVRLLELKTREKNRFSIEEAIYKKEPIEENQYIVRAATALVRESDRSIIKIFSVASPGHHAECIFFAKSKILIPIHLVPNSDEVQGFITNTGKFVDRVDGFIIAKRAKQVITKHGPYNLLFSEDMWSLTQENKVFRNHYLNHWTIKLERWLRI